MEVWVKVFVNSLESSKTVNHSLTFRKFLVSTLKKNCRRRLTNSLLIVNISSPTHLWTFYAIVFLRSVHFGHKPLLLIHDVFPKHPLFEQRKLKAVQIINHRTKHNSPYREKETLGDELFDDLQVMWRYITWATFPRYYINSYFLNSPHMKIIHLLLFIPRQKLIGSESVGLWTLSILHRPKSINPVILNVIHHCQNHLDSHENFCLTMK
jgi:hypothetical protein